MVRWCKSGHTSSSLGHVTSRAQVERSVDVVPNDYNKRTRQTVLMVLQVLQSLKSSHQASNSSHRMDVWVPNLRLSACP
jgi:hypothetical protein